MNEINVSVSFKKGICHVDGYNPINNDYNISKLLFNFDEDYEGRKVVEIRPRDSANKEATFSSEIINNEVILAKEVDGQYHSIFTTSGRHIIEVHVYGTNSKITATSEPFYVQEEQINIGDETATAYLPVFDQMMQELDNGLDSLDDALEDVNNAITETNNLDIDVSKQDKTSTIEITKKNGTTKSVNVLDGVSLQFMWQGTSLGIKTDDMQDYVFVDLQGQVGPIGPQGEAFQIKKTYATIALMVADYDNMEINDYVMISGNIEQEDNAKMFTKTETEDPTYRWQYLADFSGASGIRGQTGASVTSATINSNGELVLTVE